MHVQGFEACSLIDLINKIVNGKGWVNYYQLQGQLLGHTRTAWAVLSAAPFS